MIFVVTERNLFWVLLHFQSAQLKYNWSYLLKKIFPGIDIISSQWSQEPLNNNALKNNPSAPDNLAFLEKSRSDM